MPDLLRSAPETILVVDDDEVVLKVVVAILAEASFNVLSARDGPAAIHLADERDGVIDLLLSDVDMPAMSGPDLGERLKLTRPKMHVIDSFIAAVGLKLQNVAQHQGRIRPKNRAGLLELRGKVGPRTPPLEAF